MIIPRGVASDRIAIMLEGIRGIHAVDVTGNYATLCGLDGGIDGDDAAQQAVSNMLAKRGEKIDCPQCRAIWDQCRRYRKADFSTAATLPPQGG